MLSTSLPVLPFVESQLAALEKGDTLACFKLDRLGRSLAHLVKVIEDLDARGIHFMTAEDGADPCRAGLTLTEKPHLYTARSHI
jgi:DNA invertase Pin-like site-specific DNA recombinase